MIRCQVLGGAVVRRDDRREIARPQLVDRGNRDPARRDFRLPDRDGAIEHDDDEPSFFPGGLIGATSLGTSCVHAASRRCRRSGR